MLVSLSEKTPLLNGLLEKLKKKIILIQSSFWRAAKVAGFAIFKV